MLMVSSLEQQMAVIAHRCWCRHMAGLGWSRGPFDPATKHHDALRPFAKLSKADQRQTILAIRQEELESRLSACVRYAREPARELSPQSAWINARVQSVASPEDLGTIIAIRDDPEWPGCLETVTVKWDDGQVSEHFVPECELVGLAPEWKLERKPEPKPERKPKPAKKKRPRQKKPPRSRRR